MEKWKNQARLAGMVLESTDDLSRPLSEAAELIPDELRLEEGPDGLALVWGWAKGDEPVSRWRKTDQGILEKFMGLAETEPKRILEFARRYGVLMLCEHNLPYRHLLQPSANRCQPSRHESVAVWQKYARQARAIVALAAKLHRGERGNDGDWAQLYSKTTKPVYWKGLSPEHLMDAIGWKVTQWLVEGEVRPTMTWGLEGSNPRIQLEGQGGFAAVARQLAFSVARVDGFAVCHGCGSAFIPKRRPARKKRAWCEACRAKGADVQQAKHDYRARRRNSEMIVKRRNTGAANLARADQCLAGGPRDQRPGNALRSMGRGPEMNLDEVRYISSVPGPLSTP